VLMIEAKPKFEALTSGQPLLRSVVKNAF